MQKNKRCTFIRDNGDRCTVTEGHRGRHRYNDVRSAWCSRCSNFRCPRNSLLCKGCQGEIAAQASI